MPNAKPLQSDWSNNPEQVVSYRVKVGEVSAGEGEDETKLGALFCHLAIARARTSVLSGR